MYSLDFNEDAAWKVVRKEITLTYARGLVGDDLELIKAFRDIGQHGLATKLNNYVVKKCKSASKRIRPSSNPKYAPTHAHID